MLSTKGRTILHHAASGGNVDVVKEIIDRGCEKSLIEVVMLMLLMKTTGLHFTVLQLKVKQKQHWS
jgi:ankyrin repeat protein